LRNGELSLNKIASMHSDSLLLSISPNILINVWFSIHVPFVRKFYRIPFVVILQQALWSNVRGGTFVGAVRYKPEGCRFDSR